MPGSVKHGKKIIKDFIESKDDIHTILDVGCGSGTYPKLLGKDKYEWYGVEIWAPYIEKFKLTSIYKDVYVSDVRVLSLAAIQLNDHFDCIIFGDVLEHISKSQARAVLKGAEVCNMFSRFHTVISIPLSDNCKYDSKEHHGNWFEKHKSFWKFDEVNKLADWEVAEVDHNIGVFCK